MHFILSLPLRFIFGTVHSILSVALTPPATRSSRGTASSSNQRGKRAAPALPGSSSKRLKPSPSAPRSNSARQVPHLPPPRDLGAGPSKLPPSSTGEVYAHLMLFLEKDRAPGRAADILKGALSSRDKRLLSSLSPEDLDQMLTLVLAKVFSTGIHTEGGKLRFRGLDRSQGEVIVRGLEDKVERLHGEVDALKAVKKEAGARC
ncbi:UNVERIFIED_CONTAM: hypothetical protein Sradi_6915100 [Sesamum radiatum]|uniref:Uncharacterized protein n=1 Tax=Sesamum radiatum TaxID=300843 RepID=A0AAW2JI12_SESRA